MIAEGHFKKISALITIPYQTVFANSELIIIQNHNDESKYIDYICCYYYYDGVYNSHFVKPLIRRIHISSSTFVIIDTTATIIKADRMFLLSFIIVY